MHGPLNVKDVDTFTLKIQKLLYRNMEKNTIAFFLTWGENVEYPGAKELDRYILQDVDQHTAGCAVHLTLMSKIRLITIHVFLAFKSSLQRIQNEILCCKSRARFGSKRKRKKKIRYKDWASQNSNITSLSDLHLQQPTSGVKAGSDGLAM